MAAATPNPFTPSFGSLPPELAGRDDLLRFIQDALATGPAHPGYTSLLLGPRGVGKTTALTMVQDWAQSAGWLTCRTTALVPSSNKSVARSLEDKTMRLIGDRVDQGRGRKLTGFTLGPLAAQWSVERPDAERPSRLLERALSELAAEDLLGEAAGVMLIVDEMHNMKAAEASEIAAAIQEVTKDENKPVAFIGAGLNIMAHTLLAHRGFTFFQRCWQPKIENLSLPEAKRALGAPLRNNGFRVSDPSLHRAAQTTGGFPYNIQSLGFHLWEQSAADRSVTEDRLDQAIESMRQDFAGKVVAPAWNSLTPKQREFLLAMVSDQTAVRTSEIAARMGVKPNGAAWHRKVLIDEGLIVPVGHGLVAFADEHIQQLATEHQAKLAAINKN